MKNAKPPLAVRVAELERLVLRISEIVEKYHTETIQNYERLERRIQALEDEPLLDVSAEPGEAS